MAVVEPKVLESLLQGPGRAPRAVLVERKRKEYSTLAQQAAPRCNSLRQSHHIHQTEFATVVKMQGLLQADADRSSSTLINTPRAL